MKDCKRGRYWTIANEKGRIVADGLTPPTDSDRDGLTWVLNAGPHDGTPPTIEADKLYRVRCGDAATTAYGDEFARVAASSTSTDAWCDVATTSTGHLHAAPARTAPADEVVPRAKAWHMHNWPPLVDDDASNIMRDAIRAASQDLRRLGESICRPAPPPKPLGDVELRRRVTVLLARARVVGVSLGASYGDGSIDVIGFPPGTLVEVPGLLRCHDGYRNGPYGPAVRVILKPGGFQ